MATEIIPVPDLGGADKVDVIEVCVQPGDEIEVEQSLVVLESDKASMEVPSPRAGRVVSLKINEGDSVSEGDPILELEVASEGESETPAPASDKEAAAPAPEPSSAAEAPATDAPAESAGSSEQLVSVPDLGGADTVEVIELCVAVGDEVAEGDSLIVLESDKASMEVPSPAAGKVLEMKLAEGSKVSVGDDILILQVAGAASAAADSSKSPAAPTAQAPAPAAPAAAEASAGGSSEQLVSVPDLGGADDVDVIELCVAVGDEVAEGDSLIVLETDKASMEVPSPAAGKVLEMKLAEGSKVSVGDDILILQVAGAATAPAAAAGAPAPEAKTAEAKAPPAAKAPAAAPQAAPSPSAVAGKEVDAEAAKYYAGPAVRKLARQLGVDLGKVKASGPRGRFTKEDVRGHVKQVMTEVSSGKVSAGSGIPAVPDVDFAQFGEVSVEKLSKIARVTAANMTRSWLNVPHVTQFDEADITELEEFRKSMKGDAEKRGVKLTPLPFLLKAAAAALAQEPSFNVSLKADGEHIVRKKYIHIGVAVDTPNGLMVPVIRDVDKKGLWQLASESAELAGKARAGKLMPRDMQGGCFTISSLGAMGGTGFTPIVNAPEVAIMSVSRAQIKPVWNGKEFAPRQMLPLAVSYDHRAINGGDCGRFFTYLVAVLSDIRQLLL